MSTLKDHAAGNAKFGRHLGGIGRAASRKMGRGRPGTWFIEVCIAGPSEERREELTRAMNAARGIPHPTERIGDGWMRQRAEMTGENLQVSLAYVIRHFSQALREAGFTAEEAATARYALRAEPRELDEVAVRAPKGLAKRSTRISHALGAAAEEAFDQQAMRDHGERDYHVLGVLHELDTQACADIKQWLSERGSPEELVTDDGAFGMTLGVSGVGTGFGALTMTLRKMASLLMAANPGAAAAVVCSPSSDEELEAMLAEVAEAAAAARS